MRKLRKRGRLAIEFRCDRGRRGGLACGGLTKEEGGLAFGGATEGGGEVSRAEVSVTEGDERSRYPRCEGGRRRGLAFRGVTEGDGEVSRSEV